MTPTRILQWWGNTLAAMAVLMVLTAVLAVTIREIPSAVSLSMAAIITGLLGGLIVLAVRGTHSRESNRDALIFLVLFWFTVPAVGSLPFLFLGSTDSILVAWFESVSAFTTTGASTLVPELQTRSLLLWRSMLQLFGGVAVATLAVVILTSLNLTGTGVHRSALFTQSKGRLYERLVFTAKIVTSVYIGVAAAGFLLMSVTGTRIFDALNLAMTGVATGGLTTRSVPLADYVPLSSSIILAVVCLVGAGSVAVHWDVFRARKLSGLRRSIRNVEHKALLGLFLGVGLLGFAFAGFRHATTVFLEAAYLVSSAGYDYNVIGLELLPPAVLIAVALIGGSALSTAGGLKLIRVLLLFRHLRVDVQRLSHPSRIKPVRFRGRTIADSAFLSVWMYFLGYTLMFGFGTLMLGALGLPYDVAVPASAGSLSNIGPLLETNMVLTGWRDFTDGQLLVSGLLMLVGRVEVLALLAIFSTRSVFR